MKNLFVLLIIYFLTTYYSYSQAKAIQPSIMVVPSNALLQELGYLEIINNQGSTNYIPDYVKAFVYDPDLKLVISKIGELFSERGFPLLDLEQSLKSVDQDKGEDNIIQNKNGGEISKSILDEILYRAKPDIYLELTYNVKKAGGPLSAISFNIQAKDAYTNKQIGAASGIGPNSAEKIIAKLLEEAVLTHINNLQSQMQLYFNEVNKNGREIFLRVQVFDDAGFDLDQEFGQNEDELSSIIVDWSKKNCVNGLSRIVKQTENEIRLNVNIPLFDVEDNNLPMSANEFARKLSKYLKQTFNVQTKNITQSLGDAHLVIKGQKN